MKAFIYGYMVKDENIDYINTFLKAIEEEQIEIVLYERFKEAYENHTSTTLDHKSIANYTELKDSGATIVITLGGDGTILYAATIIRDLGLPILGINLGRMGFLASTEKKNIRKAIKKIKEGDYTTKERTMLSLESNPNIFGETAFGLNDFTLHKRDTSSMVTIHTYIDGGFLNSYWADGLIVATPTGSTGYSLSCGGPIVLPESANFVITPVAPHNLNMRPMIIPDSSVVSFKIEGRAENFLCTLDSRNETVTHEHELSIRKCKFGMKLIHLDGTSFFNTIREKLAWGRDTRN